MTLSQISLKPARLFKTEIWLNVGSFWCQTEFYIFFSIINNLINDDHTNVIKRLILLEEQHSILTDEMPLIYGLYTLKFWVP